MNALDLASISLSRNIFLSVMYVCEIQFQFPGVTIYTPTYVLNQSEVIIMFDNGAGVEVVDNQGFMTARVYLPWSFIVSI